MVYDNFHVVYGVCFDAAEIATALPDYDDECFRGMDIETVFTYDNDNKEMTIWRPACCFGDNDNRRIVGIRVDTIDLNRVGILSSDDVLDKTPNAKQLCLEIQSAIQEIGLNCSENDIKIYFIFDDCYVCT